MNTNSNNPVNDKPVKIELSTNDAKLFVDFQKNYDIFSILVNSGVFNVKNGSVEINFDENGVLRNISKHEQVFKKVKIVVVSTKAMI